MPLCNHNVHHAIFNLPRPTFIVDDVTELICAAVRAAAYDFRSLGEWNEEVMFTVPIVEGLALGVEGPPESQIDFL